MEGHLKHLLLCAALVVAVFVSSGAEPALASAPYQITSTQTTHPGSGFRRTVYTIQAGASSLDTFKVIRVLRAPFQSARKEPVMLISPFGFPATFWEITTSGYADSFVARVARSGYDVWLVEGRLSSIAPGSCESNAVDCSPMANWGVDTGVDDAMFVQTLVRQQHPLKRPVIGGFSGGSSTSLATVNLYPEHFSGLFLWEGTLYSADPDVRARNAAFCEDDEDMLAAGVYYDPAVQGFKTLFALAQAAPTDPSPIPLFPPGTTNLQALMFALSMPDPTNPLNFTEGFVRFVGNPFTTSLTYSNLARVMKMGPLIGTYAPVRFTRDSHCAMGGVDDSYTDNLSAFHGDALVFAEGLGFGQMMLDTAGLLTNADVTIDYRAHLAESDGYFHNNWVSVSVNPLLNWLDGVHFGLFF